MALAAVHYAMNLEGKTVHPFFSKPPTSSVCDQPSPAIEQPIDNLHHDPDYTNKSPSSGKERKKRTRTSDGGQHKKSGSSDIKCQVSLAGFTRSHKVQGASTDATKNGQRPCTPPIQEDLNHDRRKRLKTVSPESSNGTGLAPSLPEHADWKRQLQFEAGTMDVVDSRDIVSHQNAALQSEAKSIQHSDVHTTFQTTTTVPNIVAIPSDVAANEPPKTTPKKQIRVTKTGKLLSSPPKKIPEPSVTPKKRRSASKRTKLLPTVTVVKYGADLDVASRTALGRKIDGILNGSKRSRRGATIPKKEVMKQVGPSKAPHPFFTGKGNQAKDSLAPKGPVEQHEPTLRKSAVTPGKLRAEARRDRSSESTPTFGISSKSNRVNKQLGLNEAMWPTRGSAHVRNLDVSNELGQVRGYTAVRSILKPRKLKRNVIRLSKCEEIITLLHKNLQGNRYREVSLHSTDFEPPKDVRLPKRLLTTGSEIQERVRSQVQTVLPNELEQDNAFSWGHPVVLTLFEDIKHSLTPFDEGKCEPQAWNQKYSPRSASQVLQTGSEAALFKDWLQSLTVLAVGGTLKVSAPSDMKKPPKKKRKKAVDDFIVFDDEEDDEDEDMVEVRSAKDLELPASSRSMVIPRWTRNKNVILVSGPHGCGKSAMIHAVAGELGFEVFEIHSGVRRSGKDIQDKVGDMTANHLVNHKRNAIPSKDDAATAENTDNERMDTALEDDLTSGRQGTMTAFFKAKPGSNQNPTFKMQGKDTMKQGIKSSTSIAQAVLPLVSAANKSQKQSLVLFEEADILFEEDQQFWAQVTKLALNSKRPIVITCNDERQIPIMDLPLAAILRLPPPPPRLATNYLLALAGREGHILTRQAVWNLYDSKRHDLRASIAELNFWCQMSVGDRKGGLEWFYQRWPPGKDIDEHGQLLRVASQHTYQVGMGWLSHNMFETHSNAALGKEEELLRGVWTDWGISPTDWISPDGPAPEYAHDDQANPLEALKRFEDLAESLSAADVYCCVGLPSYDDDYDKPTDPTLPAITEKARLSYTLAAPLLEVDHCSDCSSLDTSLSVQTHMLIQRTYPDLSWHHTSSITTRPTTETDYAKKILSVLHKKRNVVQLSRRDFAEALDVLAVPPDHTQPERTFYNLTPSSFDRTFSIIALDLAPYVRSIVAHEQVLEAQRLRVSNLLSAGGSGKRVRTTRAARVALEGGIRETKRRDRWFDNELNFELVMRTAGREWAGLGWKGEGLDEHDGTGSLTGTMDDSHDTDVSMQASQELQST